VDRRGRRGFSAVKVHVVRRSSGIADRANLAEWERRAFTVLREHAELVTIVDDEMPEEAWRDLDEMRVTLLNRR